ncbi:hypothetical protein EMCRGX_G004718 [Ephydatia muelleri]
MAQCHNTILYGLWRRCLTGFCNPVLDLKPINRAVNEDIKPRFGTHMHTNTDLRLWFGSCHDEKTTGYLAMWPLDIGGSRNHSNITYSTTALCRACGHVCMIM